MIFRCPFLILLGSPTKEFAKLKKEGGVRALLVITSMGVSAMLLASPAHPKTKQASERPYPFVAPVNESDPYDFRTVVAAPRFASGVPDTVELAFFDFDDGVAPSAQGWTSVDGTAQKGDFFHVAGASELNGGQGGGLVPIEGNRSLWCGAAPSTSPLFCSYATLPGYGNGWQQLFASQTLNCDSIHFCYKIRWDSEPGYDQTFVEYYNSAFFSWFALPVTGGSYSGSGTRVECIDLTPVNQTTRLRFRFQSDGGLSDEDGLYPTDGAVLIDSITVACYNGGNQTLLLYEDFEGEAPGAKVTDDGWWATQPTPAFGDFAAMYPGSDVLQEDPCVTNDSNLWAFFTTPAFASYNCHLPEPVPTQGVTPYVNDDGLYMDNQIWSPNIEVTGSGSTFVLSFQVYRDLPIDNLVTYTWAVRSWVAGCPGPWKKLSTGFLFGAQRDFYTHTASIGTLIDPAATQIQIAIGARDVCDVWCGTFGTGACHSHAPLIDDVRLLRVNNVGPQYAVDQRSLFQDNFAQDGTLTGVARADAAIDVLPALSPGIAPGDSISLTVTDPSAAIAVDPLSGVGPAIYAYVSVRPPGQPGKSGANLEAPETRTIGKRYPLVGSLVDNGVTWNCFRMDAALTSGGTPIANRYCFDLKDAVLTPGDTIYYFFKATNTSNESNYFSRRFSGQGQSFVSDDIGVVVASPMEFTILPAGGWRNGGDILYVDDADDRGGDVPIQLFFDSAFDAMHIAGQVDRYDVLSPSSNAGNSLASRVKSIAGQIVAPYQKIVWSSAALRSGTIGDGTGNPEKSNDFGLLFTFLNTHPNNPGLFITGDNIAEEWVSLSGASASDLRSAFMNFTLGNGNHIAAGDPVTPELVALSPPFIHQNVPDRIIAYGGCPVINDFDIVQPTTFSVADFVSVSHGNPYMVSQATSNSNLTTARVTLSGFSLHEAGDVKAKTPFARAELLKDIFTWFQNILPVPTGIDDNSPQFASYLDDNYPNPFNPTTTIRYGLEQRGQVSLIVYNAAGQRVRTLVDEAQSPRAEGFRVEWDGTSDAGNSVASGVYFYRLVTKNFELTKKMVLLK